MESKFKDCIQLGNSRNRSNTSRNKTTSLHKNASVEKPLVNISNTQNTKTGYYVHQPVKVTVFKRQHHKANQNMPICHRPQQQLLTQQYPVRSPIHQVHQVIKSPPTKRILLNSKEKTVQNLKQNISLTQRTVIVTNQNKQFEESRTKKRFQPHHQPRLTQNIVISERQQELLRKVKTLQNRLSEIVNEKMTIQARLIEQNRRLYHENQNLKAKLANDNIDSLKVRLSELQQMLESEINKSLQLMDENETLKKHLQEAESQILSKNVLYETVRNQIVFIQQKNTQIEREFNKAKESLENQVLTAQNQLNVTINQLNHQLTQIHQQKQQLLISTQLKNQQISAINNKVSEYEAKLEQLQCSLLEKSDPAIGSSKSWRTEGCESTAADKKQCKKCQQLLQTVFKLNAHLNKK